MPARHDAHMGAHIERATASAYIAAARLPYGDQMVIAAGADVAAKRVLAGSPFVDPGVAVVLASCRDRAVVEAAARRVTDGTLLRTLAADRRAGVRSAALCNVHMPPDVLVDALQAGRWEPSVNPATPEADRRALITDSFVKQFTFNNRQMSTLSHARRMTRTQMIVLHNQWLIDRCHQFRGNLRQALDGALMCRDRGMFSCTETQLERQLVLDSPTHISTWVQVIVAFRFPHNQKLLHLAETTQNAQAYTVGRLRDIYGYRIANRYGYFGGTNNAVLLVTPAGHGGGPGVDAVVKVIEARLASGLNAQQWETMCGLGRSFHGDITNLFDIVDGILTDRQPVLV
jgi:hypothetical protein